MDELTKKPKFYYYVPNLAGLGICILLLIVGFLCADQTGCGGMLEGFQLLFSFAIGLILNALFLFITWMVLRSRQPDTSTIMFAIIAALGSVGYMIFILTDIIAQSETI